MVFHSWQFAVLLTITLALYWVLANRRNLRTLLLLVSSYIFYGAWEPWFLVLLIFSTFLDYYCGLAIAAAKTQRGRRIGLWCSLTGNLSLLCYFKYSKWVAEVLDPLFARLGVENPLMPLAWKDVVPVGISFYTFQTLSYAIDVFRGTLKPVKSLRDFGVFVAFFPQLVAGPIVRAADFLPQMEFLPRFDRARLHDGLYRIGTGLAKKALLADIVGRYLVDPVYQAPESYGPLVHVATMYAFALQIYCDFSGYSDIAIGTARLFGYDLLENFDSPFQSKGVREFWRRWHISLSSWVRDYIYFPLGGSRRSDPRVAFNLMVTMVVIGLWHGASWLWVIYGVLQGVTLCMERQFEVWRGGTSFLTTPLRRAVAWFLTFNFVAWTLLFVRAHSLEQLWKVFAVYGDGGPETIAVWGWVALAAAAATHFLPNGWAGAFQRRVMALPTPALGLLLGLLTGTLFLVMTSSTPFIYFQF